MLAADEGTDEPAGEPASEPAGDANEPIAPEEPGALAGEDAAAPSDDAQSGEALISAGESGDDEAAQPSAVDAVVAQIDALATLDPAQISASMTELNEALASGAITVEEFDAQEYALMGDIWAAADAYDALTEDEQAQVANYSVLEALLAAYYSPATLDDGDVASGNLSEGVNVLTESVTGVTFTIDEGKVLAITGTANAPIVIEDCTFNISGTTMKADESGVGYKGESLYRLGIGGYVTFVNCDFVFDGANGATGGTCSASGNDACIEFFGPEVVLNGCTVAATGWQGQFMGLYGSASVTFNKCDIRTVGNVGGWSYAMYGSSVLTLNDGSMLSATVMQKSPGGDNVNAFYSGDASTKYDAIFINDSTVNFADNQGGGFALNYINIYVTDSYINVSDNLGNACNSGYWIVDNSDIIMCGNTGGHGLSCIGFEMTDSNVSIEHNGYAGVYIQSRDSSFANCQVDIRCNGEKLLSYSAGDVWLNGHELVIDGCGSEACPGAAWLGAVGRKGTIEVLSGEIVAADLYENGTKSNTEEILTSDVDASVALADVSEDGHVLFLNPNKGFDYARGDTEGKTGNSNDDDLLEDVSIDVVIGKDSAKIGTMTTAQLAHHIYDWENPISMGDSSNATPDTYGIVKYACVDTCFDYTLSYTDQHPYSFNCDGTYVYAPLVGFVYDANAGDNEVSGMPEGNAQLEYGAKVGEPENVPTRDGYVFTGWYADADCTTPIFDENGESGELTSNWTVAFAGWKRVTNVSVSKVWDDGNNQDGVRPQSVTVNLLADGEVVQSIVLSEENGWSHKFNNVDVLNDNGEKIVYTVTEDAVANYKTTVSGSAEEGFVVTNAYTPGQTSVSVVKRWTDRDDRDGLRPESVEVTLLADGAAVATQTLSAQNGWACTFSELPVSASGKPIAYTVEEKAVEGYTTTVTGNAASGFIIENRHVTYTVTVNYLDRETGEALAEPVVVGPANEGASYNVAAYDKAEIAGYDYDATEGDALTGTLDADKVVDVYYTKAAAQPVEPTEPAEPEKPTQPQVPQTGDATNLAVPVAMALGGLVLAGLAVALVCRRRSAR